MTIIVVTRVSGDGAILTRTVNSDRREDAARWEHLAEDAALGTPPPYRPAPGAPVYRIQADEQDVDVAEPDLEGPLRDLVTAVIAEGDG